MKNIKVVIFFVLFVNLLGAQTIQSGEYELGLKLAFDRQTKMLTGYFEDYTGWDEETQNPRFSCIFYIEGRVTDQKFKVLTYYPEDKLQDTISGQIEILNHQKITLKLSDEHGGCWNVQHFADEPILLGLETAATWTQIKYVVAPKTYFYAQPSAHKKLKAYLVKNDLVCVDKTQGNWAYVTFIGKRTTQGWIKTADLNKG